MGLFEQVMYAAFGLIVIFLFWPGIRELQKRSPRAKPGDWWAVIMALGAVVLFVVIIIKVAAL